MWLKFDEVFEKIEEIKNDNQFCSETEQEIFVCTSSFFEELQKKLSCSMGVVENQPGYINTIYGIEMRVDNDYCETFGQGLVKKELYNKRIKKEVEQND